MLWWRLQQQLTKHTSTRSKRTGYPEKPDTSGLWTHKFKAGWAVKPPTAKPHRKSTGVVRFLKEMYDSAYNGVQLMKGEKKKPDEVLYLMQTKTDNNGQPFFSKEDLKLTPKQVSSWFSAHTQKLKKQMIKQHTNKIGAKISLEINK